MRRQHLRCNRCNRHLSTGTGQWPKVRIAGTETPQRAPPKPRRSACGRSIASHSADHLPTLLCGASPTLRWTAPQQNREALHAPVAQLDRASVYGTEGYWFESSRVYCFSTKPLRISGVPRHCRNDRRPSPMADANTPTRSVSEASGCSRLGSNASVGGNVTRDRTMPYFVLIIRPISCMGNK